MCKPLDFFKNKIYYVSYFVGLAHLGPGGEFYRGLRRLEQVQAYNLAYQYRSQPYQTGEGLYPCIF